MSIFGYHKPTVIESNPDALRKLRQTIKHLEAEREQTPQIANLKRVLATRIQELESKTA